MKKKTLISFFSLILIVIILCLPYWINDYSCSVYTDEVEKRIADVPEISVLQVVSGCGNSTGTGDHTDLYVAALVETNLSEADIESRFTDIADIHDVGEDGEYTLAMELINLHFDEENFDDKDNLYILEFSKRTPFSALDLRGA